MIVEIALYFVIALSLVEGGDKVTLANPHPWTVSPVEQPVRQQRVQSVFDSRRIEYKYYRETTYWGQCEDSFQSFKILFNHITENYF